MSSSTDEKEGWHEAPEQPEPPHVRETARKIRFLPMPISNSLYMIPLRKFSLRWPATGV
jgi:hypothetical protein